ncbi:MAG: hydantoinase B/oxoprolinase family protein, partial [Gemmataceae bacterium]
SSINFYLSEDMFKMFFGAFTINLIDPQILFNDGFYDLVEVRIPQGTLLKPNYPAALSGRTHALGRIFDVMGGLLGQSAPEAMNAAGFSDSPHLFFAGYDDNGEWFQLFQIGFGGIPGRPVGDGPDGHSLWPGFTNVPNEFIEAYFTKTASAIEGVGLAEIAAETVARHARAYGDDWCSDNVQRSRASLDDDERPLCA